MEDIAPKLIEEVNKDFNKNVGSKKVKELEEKATAGKATYDDAYKYAEEVGKARSKALLKNVTSEMLPNGTMYYNIADRLMNDSLSTDHDMVTEYAAKAQEAINKRNGINLKAQTADLDQDRIDGFVNGLSGDGGTPIEEVAWKLGEPIITHARTVVDATVKKNAEFQNKAGIRATVTRKAAAKCCDWCADLDGDYTYPSVPREVFQRHDNCRCPLDYEGKKLTAYKSITNGKAHTFRDLGETQKLNARQDYNQDATSKIEFAKEARRAKIESEQRMKELVGKTISKADNQRVREWYVANVSDIPNQIDRTQPMEKQARQAFELRNQYKHEARIAMSDAKQAELLEKYRPAPTFEQLLDSKVQRKGLTREEALEDILKTASKTNKDVNKEFGL